MLEIGTPEAVGLSSERLGRIVPWMRGYVEAGKLPGLSVTVARRGQVVFSHQEGLRDLARGLPMEADTIVRIYSMTKPLTSVAILMLYEEGLFQLDDPITRFLPEFRDMRVLVGGSRAKPETVPAERDITFRDLLTHTSGLSYGFMDATLVDRMYREEGVDFQTAETSLAAVVGKAASLPLLAQPGAEWNYSIATDVLGHLVAVISGKSFDDFLRERIIRPLGMVDTDFHVPAEKISRFASNYALGEGGRLTLIDDAREGRYARPRTVPSGGGGLVATAADYARFCRFVLGGGELDGVRLLGAKTVELMTANHLRGDLADMGQPRFSESSYSGIGFGLGFSVMLDPARAQILGTSGEVAWGGAASTAFWIDPAEDLFVIMLTQLMPSSTWPIRRELRVLTYAAITG
ncbi:MULTISPECIES: serine hydrolase domain-containing protein [Methylobacterium]|uniref:serine hydrolase domain-containing protein n=1 Tax=Methylobacterium TaxID=407 RepID=UPI001587639C|nr:MULTISPECIES: serine hydrolase domain-containing protein [Methylobacterium]MBK3397555.1 beta-lactamase family protein [Methylobacterium ajmalii]MBK3411586.1 beta-lactamase family protein [Methylobacterium ajmalii]MBK3421824.1 beta-lactamase family protein [Methylobacterium ajmalii]MBZ6415899.1 beta-lactamase family protein [Methylobacterium sp.]